MDITLDKINEIVESVFLKEFSGKTVVVIKFRESLTPLLRGVIKETYFRVHWIEEDGRYREDRPPYLESRDKRIGDYLIINNGDNDIDKIIINIDWLGYRRAVKLELLRDVRDREGVQKSFIYEIKEE